MFQILFGKISRVKNISSSTDETWIALNIKGVYQSIHNKSYFVELHEEATNMGLTLSMFIDNDRVNWANINEDLIDGSEWRINIDKTSLYEGADVINNFFFHKEKFLAWINDSNPFSSTYPLNDRKCKIEVYGLETPFGGPNFLVGSSDVDFPDYDISSYQERYILSINRFFASQSLSIYPSNHILTFGEVNEYSNPFYRNAIQCMALSLCDEIFDEKVILRGVRRIEQTRSWTDSATIDIKDFHDTLLKTIRWVYDADSRYELRHKLLMDRITLDIPVNGSITDGLAKVVRDALEQAVERYHFAIYERGTQYQKELRDLLKDIRTLSDSYSSKVRSVISNLSRDVLAGLLTVGVTLFSKYSELTRLSDEGILAFVFKAYGVYYLCSILIQSVVDWMDLSDSEHEFDHWKDSAREYLTEDEFQKHKNETVGKRKTKTICQYIAVGVLYIGLSIFCFYASGIWSNITDDDIMQNNKSDIEATSQDVDSTLIKEKEVSNDTTTRIEDTTLHTTRCGK